MIAPIVSGCQRARLAGTLDRAHGWSMSNAHIVTKEADGWSVTWISDSGARVTRRGFASRWRARYWADRRV